MLAGPGVKVVMRTNEIKGNKSMGMMVILILTWSHTDDLLETMRQVNLAAEACFRSHFCQRLARLDQSLRLADAHALQVGIGWHPDFGAKYTQQIIGAE